VGQERFSTGRQWPTSKQSFEKARNQAELGYEVLRPKAAILNPGHRIANGDFVTFTAGQAPYADCKAWMLLT
jgi:hypothetical protein